MSRLYLNFRGNEIEFYPADGSALEREVFRFNNVSVKRNSYQDTGNKSGPCFFEAPRHVCCLHTLPCFLHERSERAYIM